MTLFVPGRLVNPLNQRWSKFGQRVRWARTWRDATDNALLSWWATHPEDQWEARGLVWQPIAVIFTGFVRRRFDSDGFQAAVKPVRDHVANACGVSDGPDGGCTWEYWQVVTRDPQALGVGVKISRVASGTALPVAVERLTSPFGSGHGKSRSFPSRPARAESKGGARDA